MAETIPGIGHNSGKAVEAESDIKTRRDAFVREIEAFARQRRPEEALSAAELGALDGLGRLAVQRQSLLDNFSQFYKDNPRADPAPAILLLITYYSDNEKGLCSLSLRRMGSFLHRDPRRISAAIQRLIDDKLIHREQMGDGTVTSLYFPWIHKSFGRITDPITWILDARSSSPLRQPGRPLKPEKVPLSEDGVPLAEDGVPPSEDGFNIEINQHLSRNPSSGAVAPHTEGGPSRAENPSSGPSTNTTKNNTTKINNPPSPQGGMTTGSQVASAPRKAAPRPDRFSQDQFGIRTDVDAETIEKAGIRYNKASNLEVWGATRDEMLKLAGGDEQQMNLDLLSVQGTNKVGPSMHPLMLKSKALGAMAELVAKRRDSDRRYQQAAASNQSQRGGRPSAPSTKTAVDDLPPTQDESEISRRFEIVAALPRGQQAIAEHGRDRMFSIFRRKQLERAGVQT